MLPGRVNPFIALIFILTLTFSLISDKEIWASDSPVSFATLSTRQASLDKANVVTSLSPFSGYTKAPNWKLTDSAKIIPEDWAEGVERYHKNFNGKSFAALLQEIKTQTVLAVWPVRYEGKLYFAKFATDVEDDTWLNRERNFIVPQASVVTALSEAYAVGFNRAAHFLQVKSRKVILFEPLPEGKTLEQKLMEENSIPPEQAGKILLQIVEQVKKAHDRGIVLLDLTPKNIWIDMEGNVTIFDFDLSAFIRDLPNRLYLRDTGTDFFTSKHRETLSEHTAKNEDLFSLGVLFAELLLPYQKIIRYQNGYTFEFISSLFLADMTANAIPKGLHRIFTSLLKDQEATYETAAELIRDLKAWLLVSSKESLSAEINAFHAA